MVAQNELLLNSAYGLVMKKILHKKLSASKLLMIDVANWKKTSHAPRKEVNVNTWSTNGLECRRRALLECEWRFFGNRMEVVLATDDSRLQLLQ